jgi:hypothetical protein
MVAPPPTENGSEKTMRTGADIPPVLNHRGIMKIDHFGKQAIRYTLDSQEVPVGKWASGTVTSYFL